MYSDNLTDEHISIRLTTVKPGHSPFDRLVDLLKDDLSAEQQAESAAHIATCAHCTDQVSWLEHILELYRTDHSISAPPAALTRVRSFFGSGAMSHSAGQVRRITAVLTFDSQHAPLAIGMRSDMALKRQLMFRAEELDLDLHVVSTGARWIISGQVLGSDADGQAELQRETGTLLATAPLNGLRQFTLPPVVAGTYTLLVQLSDTVIEIPGLEIGT